MNNKDREALDKFLDEDSLSPEDTKKFAEMSDGERATFIAERCFQAGAKHGRSQLNELRDDNMSELYDLIKKLQKEIDELTSILDLKKETIVEMQNAYETLNAHDEMLIATVDKLKEENRKLVEALKFYANETHWDLDQILNQSDIEEINVMNLRIEYAAGKRARQVLKEIGEE